VERRSPIDDLTGAKSKGRKPVPKMQELNTHATRRVGNLFSPRTPRPQATVSPPLPVVDDALRDVGDVLLSLNSSPDGLQKLEAAVQRGKYGLNEVAHERAPRWYVQLVHSFHNPFIYLLITLAIVSFLTEDIKAAVIIAIMVSISVGLRFIQEFRSSQAAERLQAMVGTTATVSRPGPRITAGLPLGDEPHGRNAPRHPPKCEEVPIKLVVPGDVVHLSAGDMVPADVLVLSASNWVEAFFFSISVAVGLTPEMLPMIVTANLARGAVAMSRRKVIVKRLNAIQNFGAMDVLCTDKTGTLTQDKVVLLMHLNVAGEEDDQVLEYAFLNSHFQTGLKNLLDKAILEHEDLVEPKRLTDHYLKYDLSQTAIPFDRVDDEYLKRPRKWQIGAIGRFMLSIGPISSVFDLTTFALLWFTFGANNVDRQSLFQTGWFVEGLLSQTLIIHMIRTVKVPFVQSRAAAPLMLLTMIVMAAGIAIPYTWFGATIGLVALPATYFPWLAATLVGYCTLTQIIKRQFLRRYG
jgi:magnesium-transporting ATPase (P-type)